MTGRPGTNEYADYYERYVGLVPDGDIAETLARQIDESLATYREHFRGAVQVPLRPRTSGRSSRRWATSATPSACSRIARSAFARGDGNPLPSFDQDEWMPFADSDSRTWRSLLEELKAIRASTVALFRSLSDEALSRRGVASGKEVSVLALGFIAAGHERHHLTVLKTKYLAAPDYPGHQG